MTEPSRRPPAPSPHDRRPTRGAHGHRRHSSETTGEQPQVQADSAREPYSDPTLPPPTPVLLARVVVALYTAALTGGVLVASLGPVWIFGLVILVLQVLLVVAYVRLRQPPGAVGILVTGLVVSVAADWVALYSSPFSFDNMIYVLAGALGLTIIGQLVRPTREDLTVSMGTSLLISSLACLHASWIGVLRQDGGGLALQISVIAVGAGVMAARACDLTLPKPRINRQVPRGAFGIVIGAMFAAAGAAYASVVLEGPSPLKAAIGGLVIGMVGVLADLASGFTQAGRRIAGTGVALWPVRHGLGPLLAFGAAAPVAYLLCVYYIVRGI